MGIFDWRKNRPISAKRLHKRVLWFEDNSYWQATVFPFFDPSGRVAHFLIVRLDEPGLFSIRARDELLRTVSFSAMRLSGPSSLLERLTSQQRLDELLAFWHYDPWWMLRLDAVSGMLGSVELRATNCVPHLPHNTRACFFDPSLRQVVKTTEGNDEGTQERPWKTIRLEDRATKVNPSGVDRRTWILAPFWQS